MDGCSYNAIYLLSNTAKELQQKIYKLPGFYEFMAKGGSAGALENGGGVAAAAAAAAVLYNNWGMHSKYSGSGSNIFNEANKSCVYISGPSGIHVCVSDEVLNNEVKDGSLYALDVQGGKVIMKLINKQDNNWIIAYLNLLIKQNTIINCLHQAKPWRKSIVFSIYTISIVTHAY